MLIMRKNLDSTLLEKIRILEQKGETYSSISMLLNIGKVKIKKAFTILGIKKTKGKAWR